MTMRILGIETSCDETAIAVLEVGGPTARPWARVLANIIASQVKLHAKFGGVVPHLAKREHQRNLVPVLLRALRESGIRDQGSKKQKIKPPDSKFRILNSILEREPELLRQVERMITRMPPPDIDAIAVTIGPGLAPALWAGVNFARALAFLWRKPLIPVNHLEGHIYTNMLQNDQRDEGDGNGKIVSRSHRAERCIGSTDLINFRFPALCLIVSGGHTELVLMRRYGDYRVIGETLDDAAGEAFDKVAKMLGLGFPGGPVISRLAETGNAAAFKFPRPMLHSNDLNFSFSGLKTAVLYTIRDMGKISAKTTRDIAASFEQAAVDVLVAKTVRAARTYRVKTVLIGGGVAANRKLRAELGVALRKSLPSTQYLVPSTSLTGDNALMIALAGWFGRGKRQSWEKLSANANLRLDGKTPH